MPLLHWHKLFQKELHDFWRQKQNIILTGQFLPREATLYATVCRLSLRQSLCMSVTFRFHDHISWNTSKIISQLISLRFMFGLTSTSAIWSNGDTPKLEWNMGDVKKTCIISEIVQDRTNVYDALIGSRIRAFRAFHSYTKINDLGWPWTTL